MNKTKTTATHPDEMLYLVNKKNEIIGSIVRREANANPLYTHREVGILIVNKKNEILLQKRSLDKKVHPGMWSLTAGHITYGQTPTQAAKNEVAEEVGLNIKLQYLTTRLNEYLHESHFMYYYLGLYHGEKIKIQESEVMEVDFFSRKKLNQLQKSEEVNTTHLPIFEKYWQGQFQDAEDKLEEKN